MKPNECTHILKSHTNKISDGDALGIYVYMKLLIHNSIPVEEKIAENFGISIDNVKQKIKYLKNLEVL